MQIKDNVIHQQRLHTSSSYHKRAKFNDFVTIH